MARPCKVPTDPKVYAELIEALAYGLPVALIAAKLGVPTRTVYGWTKRKIFSADLAAKKLAILMPEIREVKGLTLLERHPDTREVYGPPRSDFNLSGGVNIHFSGWDGKCSEE